MKKIPLCLAILLIAIMQLAAQNKTGKVSTVFTVKGQVVDSLTKETIPYATLRVVSAAMPSKPVKLQATDDNGTFSLTLNAPGKYILTTQSIGKIGVDRHFTLASGHTTLDLGKIFMNDDVKNIKEVTVTAQKPLVKVEIDKLTYNMSDDPEAQTSNTLDMLRKVPMVTVDGEDNVQLKGSSNFKIYVNGKPSTLLSSSNASTVLKSMPASSIKNIEVITDPGSKYDAEGVGGIINIITAKNALEGYTGNVSFGVGTLGGTRQNAYLSLKAGKFGLTANYGGQYERGPWNQSLFTRTTNAAVLTQNGRSKGKGPFNYGSLEASYEIDTLNLLSLSGDLFNGQMKSYSELVAENIAKASTGNYSYNRNSFTKNEFGDTNVNFDYQHSTHKKDEMLTFSYRYSGTPNNSRGNTDLTNVKNYYLSSNYPQKTINDASTNEHTAQIDYTTPTGKNQTFEAGVKYIFRESKSTTEQTAYVDSLGTWKDISALNSDFRHKQHIYSAYTDYKIGVGKYSVKAGVRAEGTSLKATFQKAPEQNFSTHYFDVVPNATVAYQVNMTSQFRLGYNMRIQRPGIWYLNPYINDVDPQNVSQGNAHLDSEKSNSVDLSYSMFGQKFSINASVDYSFINNSIESYSEIAKFPTTDPRSKYNGAMWSTYGNIGKQHSAGGNLYIKFSPVQWFNFTVNSSVDYTNMKSSSMNLQTDGFSSRNFAMMMFTLPQDFRITGFGGFMSPRIQLQGKMSSFSFHGMNVSKDFMKKKLSVNLAFQSPFQKNMKFKYTTHGTGYDQVSTNYRTRRELSLSVSYRFGTLNSQIKKVRHGISNDDQKAGGNGNAGGGTETGGGMN